MNYKWFLLTCFAIFLHVTTSFAIENPADSIGVERKNGVVLVLHKVTAGETLFSLSKHYNSTVEQIIRSNPNKAVNQLAIGDTLRIPVSELIIQPANANVIAVHEVSQSETLYSIAKKYKVDVQQIKSWNNLGNQPLAIGQKLMIYEDNQDNKDINNIPLDNYLSIHVVKQGETLYSVSKDYQVTIDQLVQWNHLPNNTISLGQKLVVGHPDAPPATPTLQKNDSTAAAIPTDTLLADVEESDDAINPTPTHSTAQKSTEPIDTPENKEVEEKKEIEEVKEIREEEKKDHENYKKVTQTGFASTIDGTENTKKYLALHKNAPVGTIMQVRNEMNNLSVFVRVIGKLPNTGVNNKLSIRITQAAYESLGGLNERIPVEISYIP